MASIELQGIVKDYGKHTAIHGVDLQIDDGQFVAFVGPSGCGKSTMLRMIAGLEEITGGVLRIGERKANELEPKDRDVAMVFQDYALYPHMSIRENIGFGLKMRGWKPKDIAPRVENSAKILQISDYLDRKPGQLSGGQRQRVAMGRAIVREPSVFLFDEPLSNLDAKLRVEMRTQIKRLHAMLGTTMVYVTHDQTEAMTLADKVVVLKDGHIIQQGPPLELYNEPNSRFVGEFIGSPQMNIFSGKTSRKGNSTILDLEGAQIDLGDCPLAPDRLVDVGIRPEHLELANTGEELISAKVDVIEPLGSDTMAICHIGENELSARLDSKVPLSVGANLSLKFDLENLHFFDTKTGQRI